MVNESGYMTLDRPFIPEQDTLCVILRRGSVKRPVNWLQDIVVEANMALCVASTDDLYTWANFKNMIEFEYGCMLQDFLDARPGNVLAALQDWLGDYMAAHNNPEWKINGWEYTGYTAPVGEPMAGLLPLPPEE